MTVPIARRKFVVALAGAATWPLVAPAQQGDRVRRIGVLLSYDENDPEGKRRYSAVTQALADLGWTVAATRGWTFGGAAVTPIGYERSRNELVGLQPDIILTNGAAVAVALQRETRTIPIVFASVSDPVASGIVARLDRPSGNMTDFRPVFARVMPMKSACLALACFPKGNLGNAGETSAKKPPHTALCWPLR
jgi:putative ABC transport system substrate-binding protein